MAEELTTLQLPLLETARLVLEPLAWRHSAGMFTLWSSADVCRYSGDAFDYAGARIPLPAQSIRDSDRIVDFFLRWCAAGKGCRWAMVLKDGDDGRGNDHGTDASKFIGALGFNALTPTAELAYHLHPQHWGNGYAQEACESLLAWLAQKYPGRDCEVFVERDNVASLALAARLGFAPTGVVKDSAARFVRTLD